MSIEEMEKILQSFIYVGEGSIVTLHEFDIEAFKKMIEILEGVKKDR